MNPSRLSDVKKHFSSKLVNHIAPTKDTAPSSPAVASKKSQPVIAGEKTLSLTDGIVR